MTTREGIIFTPPDTLSAERRAPSWQEYLLVQLATQSILSQKPNGKARSDFLRPAGARSAYQRYLRNEAVPPELASQYLTDAINPRHGIELTEEEYVRLANQYGAGTIRLSLIDQNMANFLAQADRNQRVLGAGGMCAQETVDTQIKQYLARRQNGGELVRRYTESTLALFPSWTQVTGGVTPVAGLTVLFDETFPWYLKIAKEGVTDAETKTRASYDRVIAAVTRYAKLIDPQNEIVRVPFSALNLQRAGQLQRWYDLYSRYLLDMQKKYGLGPSGFNPDSFLKGWVAYTYKGPEILDVVKQYIYNAYPALSQRYDLNLYTLFARSKQIDHLTEERVNDWLFPLILGSRPSEKTRALLSDSEALRHLLAIGMWSRDQLRQHPVGFSGFLDFSFGGELTHETLLFNPKKWGQYSDSKLLDLLTTSPLRLHTGNVDSVINFLSRFTSNQVGVSKDAVKGYLTEQEEIQKMTQKIEKLETIEFGVVFFEDLFALFRQQSISNDTLDYPTNRFATSEQFQQMLKLSLERYKGRRALVSYFNQNRDSFPEFRGQNADEVIISLIKFNKKEDGSCTLQFDDRLWPLAEILSSLFQNDMPGLKEELARFKETLAERRLALEKSTGPLAEQLVRYNDDYLNDFVHLLPLADNMFVSYVQQLLFVPAIRQAYVDMARIEVAEGMSFVEKEKYIAEAIRRIYPVVIECLHYIMQNDEEYPYGTRFMARYRPVDKNGNNHY